MIDWVKFLRERDGLPVRYVSPHNEGESWRRWDAEGRTENAGHDYNLYWPPEHINTFLKTMPGLLEEHGLGDVGVTPGEPSNWWRFTTWGYADAITGDRDAMAGIDLLTSHGFYLGPFGRWHGDHNVHTARKFREAKPGLRSWVTSTSWKKMDSRFVFEQFGTIYLAEANAIIPWAGMQRPVQWIGGDPNPGCAIRVSEEGDYTVLPGYHFYKQLTRLGRPGTDVVETFAMDSEVVLIGFGRGDSDGPDGFAAVNIDKNPRSVSVALSATDATAFRAVRTTEDGERYAEAGRHTVSDETLSIRLPARSVTSFFGESD